MDELLARYIPAGSLRIEVEQAALLPDIWTPSDLRTWHFFSRPNDGPVDRKYLLPQTSQVALWSSPVLTPWLGLFDARWIQMSFNSGIVRVYIAPRDQSRHIHGRAKDGKLAKVLASLLKELDYSPATWRGANDAPRLKFPLSDGDGVQEEGEQCSLLDLFNNLPSPDPPIDLVTPDSFNALAMQGILDSNLRGLHTSLYPHQRRSAAVMLQREVEPGRVVDPRLRHAIDQDGQPWYFDQDVGLVLREARFYDQSSGGILAEEMGTGKTLICLAVILATRHFPTEAPEPLTVDFPRRRKVGSLVDMAAAAVNRFSYPWQLHPQLQPTDALEYYGGCVKALEASQNRAVYEAKNPLVETRKTGRTLAPPTPARKIYLSSTSLIVVPNNLVIQWQQEIKKHTSGLRVLTMTDSKVSIPHATQLLAYDIILFSQSRFERIERERMTPEGRRIDTHCPLEFIRFKRCIIDEGHKLGTGSAQWKSDLIKGFEKLEIAARWCVTGTPSRGLYGVDQSTRSDGGNVDQSQAVNNTERDDLHRIGNIASKFLKIRPWSNTRDEVGDTPADWNVYVMQPSHHSRSSGRMDCLKSTLKSLIIRNRLSDVSQHLPPVDEKIVVLEGSYQDKLSMNLFSMMIIFNSVQSQRTDQDYFFHSRQRRALLQLASNLKQSSFFGGVFWSTQEINKSLETAETFLESKEVPISQEDHDLLAAAISFGKLAVKNRLKDVSNQFHSMPLFLEHFPGGNGKHWSLDGRDTEDGEAVCSDAVLVSRLQKVLNPCIDAPTSLQRMIESGQLAEHGDAARSQALLDAIAAGGGQDDSNTQPASTLAGNTMQGSDHHTITRSAALPETDDSESSVPVTTQNDADIEIAKPLAKTRIISTVSAKLSYLIDAIIKHQDDEQIIIFYENDNVAWYLAGVLEILQVQHLIYTRKGLDAKRRAQYVSTFTHNPNFRVLLMDISQAAFGLDMRSASRIYFISPVLNPQVEAQAIGRARRISQQNKGTVISVETLVLKDSIEELIVSRRRDMTVAEHRRVKTILDDRPMHDWIRGARILPMPAEVDEANDVAQTARLTVPQFVFGRGFGRELHPDDDLVMAGIDSPESKRKNGLESSSSPTVTARRTGTIPQPVPFRLGDGLKRSTPSPAWTPMAESVGSGEANADANDSEPKKPPKKKVRVVFSDDT